MDRLERSTAGRRSRTVTTRKRGRYVRARPSPRDPSDLALDATLRAAAPHQLARHENGASGPALRLKSKDYQRKVRVKRAANLVLFVVDASWSMAAEERMEATKGAILALLTDAYQRRDRVGLIVFRQDRATLILPPTNSVERAHKLLADLPVGGKTPLAAGVWLALRTVKQELARHPDLMPLVVFLTDGGGNISMGDLPPQEEAYLFAEELQAAAIPSVVINMEAPQFDQGLAEMLAAHLGGECYKLNALQAELLVEVVGSKVGGANPMKTPKIKFALIVLLLFLLPFLLFWRLWWPAPTQRLAFEDGDFVTQHYPMRAFVAREYRAGRLPLWSPYTFSGEPTVAESLYTVFYPLGLVELLFPTLPFWVLEVEVLLYLGLAGFFTFLFVRQLTGRWEAALLAGATFSLSGFLTSYPSLQMIILQVALWLPAGLWLLERALQRRSLWELGWAGAAFGIGLLGGHFQTFLYVAYLTAAYFVFRVWRLRLSWRFIGRASLILAAVVICVGAPQWLPSAEMAGRSPRAELPYEVVAHGFQPEELWGLLRPNMGEWSPLYVGLIPLGLALFALLVEQRAARWFWAGVFVVALLLSLGGNGFLYPFFHALAPGFQLFRDQERAAFLVTFALVVLAGYGYARLAQWPRWPRWGWVLLLLLSCGNLYYANQGVILQELPPGGYTAPPKRCVICWKARQLRLRSPAQQSASAARRSCPWAAMPARISNYGM